MWLWSLKLCKKKVEDIWRTCVINLKEGIQAKTIAGRSNSTCTKVLCDIFLTKSKGTKETITYSEELI